MAAAEAVKTDVASQAAEQLRAQLARPNMEAFATAYAAAWGEMPHVRKNSNNPHLGNDYADLEAILDTIRPVFAKHKLALFQSPGKLNAAGDRVEVLGVLFHASGQSVSVVTEMLCSGPVKKDGTQMPPTAQTIGSAISYAKRYQAQAIGGLAQTDDDGNAAAGQGVEAADSSALDEDAMMAFVGSVADFEKAFRSKVENSGLEGKAGAALVNKYTAKRKELKSAAKA